jgi:hypothetical protein
MLFHSETRHVWRYTNQAGILFQVWVVTIPTIHFMVLHRLSSCFFLRDFGGEGGREQAWRTWPGPLYISCIFKIGGKACKPSYCALTVEAKLSRPPSGTARFSRVQLIYLNITSLRFSTVTLSGFPNIGAPIRLLRSVALLLAFHFRFPFLKVVVFVTAYHPIIHTLAPLITRSDFDP